MVTMWRSLPYRRNSLASVLALLILLSGLLLLWVQVDSWVDLPDEQVVVEPEMIFKCKLYTGKTRKVKSNCVNCQFEAFYS